MAKTPASEVVDAFGNVLKKGKKALGQASEGVGEPALPRASDAFVLQKGSASQPITRVKKAAVPVMESEEFQAPAAKRTPEQIAEANRLNAERLAAEKQGAAQSENAAVEAENAAKLKAIADSEAKAPEVNPEFETPAIKEQRLAARKASQQERLPERLEAFQRQKQASEKGVIGTTSDLAKKAKAGTWDKLDPRSKKILGATAGGAALLAGGLGIYQGAKSLLGGDDSGPFTPKSGGNGPAASAGATPVAAAGAGTTAVARPAAEAAVAKKEPVTAEEMAAAFGAPLATLTPENAGTIRSEIASGRSKFRTAVMPDGTVGVFDPSRLPLATRQKKQSEQDAADATTRQAKKDADIKAQATMSPDEKRLAELKKQTNFTAQTAAEEKELRTRIQAAYDRKQELSVPVAVAEAKAKADAAELGLKEKLGNKELDIKDRAIKVEEINNRAKQAMLQAKNDAERLEILAKTREEHAGLDVGELVDPKTGNETIRANMERFSGLKDATPSQQGAWAMRIATGLREIADHERDNRIPLSAASQDVLKILVKAKSKAKTSEEMRQELFGEQPEQPSWFSKFF